MNAFFSIIIPTYNRGYTLQDTLESIQRQSWATWEVHIVDDGSTDNTTQIVQPFLNDSRIHYHYQTHAGPATARNLGMSKANGTVITFVDSDDPVYAHYLETAIYYFVNDPQKTFALSHCDFFYELYDSHETLVSRKPAFKEQPLPICVSDVYDWKVHVAIGTGLFLKPTKFMGKVSWNPNIMPGDDIEFFMQLACLDPTGFIYIPRALFEYRQRYGGDGLCSNTSYYQWAEMFEKIYQLHKNDVLMTQPEQYLLRVEKYKRLQKQFELQAVVPPQFKYFPEFWDEKKGS